MREGRHLSWGANSAPSRIVRSMRTETFGVQAATLVVGVSGHILSGKTLVKLAFQSSELAPPDEDWEPYGSLYFCRPTRQIVKRRESNGLAFVLGRQVRLEEDLPRAGDMIRYDRQTFCLSFYRKSQSGWQRLELPLQSRNGFLAYFAQPKRGLDSLRSLWSLASLVAAVRGTGWGHGDTPYEFCLTDRPE